MFFKSVLRAAIAALITATFSAQATQADVFELRVYTTHPGKLDDLHARFRNHTIGLFKKHGMESVGYWVPTDKPKSENTLIYVLRHKSRDAARQSWRAFLNDPEWQKVYRASEADGPILAKRPESTFMVATDYSPTYKAPSRSDNQAVFELRIYRTNPGKLPLLDARFRDHTIALFNKHGLTSVAYWHPMDEPASKDTLIYILRHPSREKARQNWRAFASDPAWKRVARESQKDGKFLRERPESTYMKATDYSPMK